MTINNDFNGQLKNIINNSVDIITNLNEVTNQLVDMISKENNNELQQVFQNLAQLIEVYLNQFDIYYKQFLTANYLVKKVKNYQLQLKHGRQDVEVPIPKIKINQKNYQNSKQATLNFIKILESGRNLLLKVREKITNTTIETVVTVKTNDGKIYRIPKHVIPDANIKTVLSTFGANQNSIFSLAYKIDVQALKEIENLNQYLIKQKENEGDEIYNKIWGIKEKYLLYLALIRKKDKPYYPVFNSKDAEIYNLMSQNDYELTVVRYAQLRRIMGGGGGYRTSQLKMGDVGLVQDKLITEKQNQVNFASFNLIKNNLINLRNIIISSSTRHELAKGLETMFTEKETLLNDEISIQANRECKQNILNLFES